jgi:spore germination protein GerM
VKRVAVALALMFLPACARSGELVVIPPDELDPTVYGEVTQEATQVDLYFVEGNRLAKVTRTGTASRPLYEVAMIQLLRGPNFKELNEKKLTSAIPDGTELVGVAVEERTARVDLSEDFHRLVEVGAETGQVSQAESIQAYLRRVAQVVWTLTEVQGIDRVQFLKNGIVEPVLDQRRSLTDSPVARSSYRSFAPRGDRTLNVEEIDEF